ncbi:MAG TPA: ankyrin repeat domain-containing protein [Terriglobales bacterium]|nr:ankyrin repeat domain-containing protein [Terriglobales bacterium]
MKNLLDAVRAGDIDGVRANLSADSACAELKDENGLSAVLLAVYYGQPLIANLLIERHPNLDIFEASATGRLDRVRHLLSEHPELVHAYSCDGWTALHLAAFFKHPTICSLLLDHGADLSARSRNQMANLPLNAAVASGSHEAAALLMDRGADVNSRGSSGSVPLHSAAANGDLRLIELLLARGADINAKMDSGVTPLALAMERNHEEAAALLRAKGGKE